MIKSKKMQTLIFFLGAMVVVSLLAYWKSDETFRIYLTKIQTGQALRIDVYPWEYTVNYLFILLITVFSLCVIWMAIYLLCSEIKFKNQWVNILFKLLLFPIVTLLFFPLFGGGITTWYNKLVVNQQTPISNATPVVFKGKACDKSGYCLDEVLVLNSKIDNNSAREILKSFDENRHVKTICFNSPGGETEPAIKIINHIKDNGLSTCLADKYIADDEVNVFFESRFTRCQSACPLIFMAADNRLRVGERQYLGVHHTGAELQVGILNLKFSVGGREYVRAYEDDLTKLKFINFTRTVPNIDEVNLTQEQVAEFGIFTKEL